MTKAEDAPNWISSCTPIINTAWAARVEELTNYDLRSKESTSNMTDTIGLTTHSGFTLNDQQESALFKMKEWFNDPFSSPYFVLKGYAGTGKTFTCKALVSSVKGRTIFTAPTNKAVKVLRQTLTNDTYKPECATIYSLLGLRMEANGEVKELKARDKTDDDEGLEIGLFSLVIVDEGSMVGTKLMPHIESAVEEFQTKFLFMGDPAQLPPVGEEDALPLREGFVGEKESAYLTTVMRHDNQILNLVTKIRGVIWHPAPSIRLASDNDDQGGVWFRTPRDLADDIRLGAGNGSLAAGRSKVIAWRNLTVDTYNGHIRRAIFGADLSREKWLQEDRAVFTGPASDLDDKPMAKTDDEGTVTSVHTVTHPVWSEFKCYRLGITLDDNRQVVGWTIHPSSELAFASKGQEMAASARSNPREWKDFWAFKEAFHSIRHAYAITAHRAQGSTYETVFVDYRDILLNRNRQEAYRCLYVACSRPTKRLYLG